MQTATVKPETKKRTKEVFPTAEVFHKWASQSQQHGRNSTRNVFFNGQTIYSYGHHFPIASFVDAKHSRRLLPNYPNAVLQPGNIANAVLFTNRSYSVTTAKHVSYCSRAINHCIKVYCANPEYPRLDDEKHIANVKDLIAGIVALCEQESKAVKYDHRGGIASQIRNLANYVTLFQLKTLKPYISTFGEAKEHNERRIREAKELTKQLRFILSLENDPLAYAKILNLDLEKAEARIARKNEKREREQRQEYERSEKLRLARLERDRLLVPLVVDHWRSGRSLSVRIPFPADYPKELLGHAISDSGQHGFYPSNVIYNLPTMLRLSTDKERIETSRQATISVETAKRIWPTLHARQNPGDVEGYRGVGFNHAQEFIIGCHCIPYCELELMAIELGLVDAPSAECQNYNLAAFLPTTEGMQ